MRPVIVKFPCVGGGMDATEFTVVEQPKCTFTVTLPTTRSCPSSPDAAAAGSNRYATACGGGEYARPWNSTHVRCRLCAIGSYQSLVAHTEPSCALCDAGTYAASNGSSVCALCASNQWQPDTGNHITYRHRPPLCVPVLVRACQLQLPLPLQTASL